MNRIFFLFSILFLSFPSWAQDAVVSIAPKFSEPDGFVEAVKLLPVIMNFVKNGQFLAAGGAVTLVLVYLIKRYVLPRTKLNTGVLPLVSAALGVFVGVGIALASGAGMVPAMLAVMAGPAASVFWDSLAKFFFPKP